MYHNSYAQKAYQTVNLQAISAGEQVARLLETAAKHILRAKQHAEQNEYEARYNATEDCLRIITGLQGCLSQSVEAAKITETLENYYNGIMILVTKINVKNDQNVCDEVFASLKAMATTWREIEKRSTAQALENAPSSRVLESLNIAAC